MNKKNNEITIREYAHKQNLGGIHRQYKHTSNNAPYLKNHNEYYHNLIFFNEYLSIPFKPIIIKIIKVIY